MSGTVTQAGPAASERFPARSSARTVKQCSTAGATPAAVKLVPVTRVSRSAAR